MALRNLEMGPRAPAAEGPPLLALVGSVGNVDWSVWVVLPGEKHEQRARGVAHIATKKACRARVPNVSARFSRTADDALDGAEASCQERHIAGRMLLRVAAGKVSPGTTAS